MIQLLSIWIPVWTLVEIEESIIIILLFLVTVISLLILLQFKLSQVIVWFTALISLLKVIPSLFSILVTVKVSVIIILVALIVPVVIILQVISISLSSANLARILPKELSVKVSIL